MRAGKAIATGIVAFVVAIADVPEGLSTWQPWTTVASVVAAAALVLRDWHRPVGAGLALAALVAVAIGAEVAGEPGQVSLGHFIVVALLVADVARHERLAVVASIGAASLVTAAAVEGLAENRDLSDVVFVAMMWALAASTALAIRWRQTASATRDDRVRAEERVRIARDLHDVVAHHVAGIAIRAEGARTLVGSDAEAVDRSLQAINATAATALDEMHGLVSMLRHSEGSAVPIRLSDLADSLESHAPLRVDVAVETPSVEPPAAVAAAVHRIALEAITNSQVHARGATEVTVDVRSNDSVLVLTIVDDGHGSAQRSRGGFGLIGMTERAEMLGGTLVAGPQRSGGWRVEARIPQDRHR